MILISLPSGICIAEYNRAMDVYYPVKLGLKSIADALDHRNQLTNTARSAAAMEIRDKAVVQRVRSRRKPKPASQITVAASELS